MLYKWPVLGHSKALSQLEKDLAQNHLSHAYLFEGPPEVGKGLVARTFAQILQCPNDFCRTCPTCKQIEYHQHIDTFEFLDEGESIKIEEVRELLSHLSTTTSGRHKIVILQNSERLTSEAANALLKALEEPIASVLFVFTTSQKQQLLSTLISRMRSISFSFVPSSSIRGHLSTLRPTLDAEELDRMAFFAMGKPGRAYRFLEDPDHFRFYRDLYETILRWMERSTVTDRMLFVEPFYEDSKQMEAFLELFLHMLRTFYLEKLEGKSIPYSYAKLFDIVEHLNKTRFELDHNVNPKLALENFMLTF